MFLLHKKAIRPDSTEDKKWQFDLFDSDKKRGFMLNTDLELAYNLDFDKDSGTSCVINRNNDGSGQLPPTAPICPATPTKNLVEKYANVIAVVFTRFWVHRVNWFTLATISYYTFMLLNGPTLCFQDATGGNVWLTDFKVVYEKMMENGWKDKLKTPTNES